VVCRCRKVSISATLAGMHCFEICDAGSEVGGGRGMSCSDSFFLSTTASSVASWIERGHLEGDILICLDSLIPYLGIV